MSEREDNCAGGGRLRLGSLFLPPSVKQPERHIGIVVNSQAGDGVGDRNGSTAPARKARNADKRDAD